MALSVKSALSEFPRPLAGMLPCGDRTFLLTDRTKPICQATARASRPKLILAKFHCDRAAALYVWRWARLK